MKKLCRMMGSIGLLCLLLTSCGHSREPQMQGRATTSTQASTTTWKADPSQMDVDYGFDEDICVEYEGAAYYGRTDIYAGGYTTVSKIVSDGEALTIPRYLAQNKVVLPSDTEISCPNLKTLTVNRGYEVLFFPKGESDLYRTEVLHLPNTYRISCYYGEGNNIYGKFTPYSSNRYSYTAADLQTPFPVEFAALREIHVQNAEHGDHVWSTDGMLYTMRSLGSNSQSVLVCLPQNYQSEDGTVTLPERTAIIQTHAIYQCRNIDRLVIPAIVGKIDPEGIVATAECPLTVVCAKGSAADEYVQLYGEQFHLTAEYLPG